MEQITLAAAIIGATQAIKELLPTKVSGWATILVSVLLGLVAGFSGFQGLDPVAGLFSALIAVGGVTTARKLSGY